MTSIVITNHRRTGGIFRNFRVHQCCADSLPKATPNRTHWPTHKRIAETEDYDSPEGDINGDGNRARNRTGGIQRSADRVAPSHSQYLGIAQPGERRTQEFLAATKYAFTMRKDNVLRLPAQHCGQRLPCPRFAPEQKRKSPVNRHRITSYNVCYTKLLRHLQEDEALHLRRAQVQQRNNFV